MMVMGALRKYFYPLLAVTAFVLIMLIVIAADRGAIAPALAVLYGFPMGDKVGHFLLMGLLAFFVALAVSPQRVRIWLGLLAAGIMLEEISQAFFPSRNFSLLDLVFSLLGVVVFGWLGAWLARRRMSAR